MRLTSLIVFSIASAILFQPASAALARPGKHDRDRSQELQPPAPLRADPGEDLRAPSLTPDAAAREIQRMHGGRVLAVQADGTGYRVKVLKDGEVRIYQVDP